MRIEENKNSAELNLLMDALPQTGSTDQTALQLARLEPWHHEGVFDFGDKAFFLRGIDNFLESARKRYTRSIPMTIWSNRFTFGGRAFCYKLRGRCEFRKIFQQESAAVLSHKVREEIQP